MSDTNKSKEELLKLVIAWRNNTPPTRAEEFDAILPAFGADGTALRWKSRIRWNVLRTRYEMDPVIQRNGKEELLDLVVTAADYQVLKDSLAELGIHKMHRVYTDEIPKTEARPNIPASLFPTIIKS